MLPWMLSVFGLAMILGYADATGFLRGRKGRNYPWAKFLACSMCLGFWIGALQGGLVYSPSKGLTDGTFAQGWGFILDGFIGSGSCLLLYAVLSCLSAVSNYLNLSVDEYQKRKAAQKAGSDDQPCQGEKQLPDMGQPTDVGTFDAGIVRKQGFNDPV